MKKKLFYIIKAKIISNETRSFQDNGLMGGQEKWPSTGDDL